jgi:hypothetical protein
MDLFFVKLGSFTWMDENFLQSSTPLAKSSAASGLTSNTAAYNGARGAGTTGESGGMKSDIDCHHDDTGTTSNLSMGNRTTAPNIPLSLILFV